MSPKRAKACCYYVQVDVLVGIYTAHVKQHGSMDVGPYAEKTKTQDSHDVPAFMRWLSTLSHHIKTAPNCLVSWVNKKMALASVFEQTPSTDPNLKKRELTLTTSPEAVATAIRVMLGHVRRVKRDPARYRQACLKLSSADRCGPEGGPYHGR